MIAVLITGILCASIIAATIIAVIQFILNRRNSKIGSDPTYSVVDVVEEDMETPGMVWTEMHDE